MRSWHQKRLEAYADSEYCGVVVSIYSDYIKTLQGKGVIESEKGFATYSAFTDGLYIENIYVVPDYRKTGIASLMADEIAEESKKQGYKYIYGSVCPIHNGATDSLKTLLAYGFSLLSSTSELILLRKEVQ